jgi:hypothetical protein
MSEPQPFERGRRVIDADVKQADSPDFSGLLAIGGEQVALHLSFLSVSSIDQTSVSSIDQTSRARAGKVRIR